MLATRWSAMSSPLLLLVSVVFLLHVLSPVSAQDSCPEGTSEDMCRSSAGSPICSDRGECVCGECHCDTMYIKGRFCECDERSCPRVDKLICGGPNRGRCACGTCACHPGWQGFACDCPSSTASCKEPGSDRICSGKGSCECGECRCYRHEGEAYSGRYCETCPTCRSKCDTYRFCAECLAFGTGPLASQCETACGQVSVEKEDDPDVSDPDERICAFLTDGGCRFQFVYGRLGKLRVRRKLECPKPAISFSPAASEDNEGPVDAAAEDRNGATTATASVAALLTVLAAAVWGR
ncbi:integrin beta-PS-like [Amphibalanus amphitrite]|uniref:integrin beta-PS-like n=1 Tax=Amphibalanus amphitrite TaxID=1232801 RepID=UPI001C913534|nr:integrin beta-PS-like [Amphibalanus amphitrite]